MGNVLAPSSEAELAEIVANSTAAFEILGGGGKRGLGRPVEAEQLFNLSSFAGIGLYEPEELILEAGAATPLKTIEAVVAAAGQQLAFEPPDLSKLYGTGSGGTLGGVVACNLSGPRRIKAGAARDHVLGATGVSGRGDRFRAGARVVKNVTGYDLPKLLTGSYGTLAALTSVTLKVLPRPETEETVVAAGLDDRAAVLAMTVAMQSPCEVSGAAHIPGTGTFLRLEGIAPSVAYRREKLKAVLGGELTSLAAEESAAQWIAIRDAAMIGREATRVVWRISAAPSEGPEVMARIKDQADVRFFFDWAGGLIWLDVSLTEDASAAIVRGAITTGNATLMRAPAAIRSRVEVFQPQAPALGALTARVKASFDPRARLNPGRMYRGI